MSSGSLPFATYHRASRLGSGTYGDVVCAYDDDGKEVALKIFQRGDDDEDDLEEDYDEDGGCLSTSPIELGALREISCLRLLRGEHAHPNITTLIDVQPHWTDPDLNEEVENGEGGHDGKQLRDALCMALPLYRGKSLHHALTHGYPLDRRTKVEIAHGILSAVAHLHDSRIIHRDIKPDNIMLEEEESEENVHTSSNKSAQPRQRWRPVLIDFSLAKQSSPGDEREDEPTRHTGEAGTATYTAPEVLESEPYGCPADLWSVGVVLLELLSGSPSPVQKEKHAGSWVEATLKSLPPDQPFPALVRMLLKPDPRQRWTARQALGHDLFSKFGLSPPCLPPVPIDIAAALPLDLEDATVPRRRRERVEKACRYLESENPTTAVAALEYAAALAQLDDAIDDPKSPLILHCVVLAYRFHEVHVLDLEGLDEAVKGPFETWTLADYVDEESTIFMLLDFCLYPRGIL
jgi:serine/threonine protein kinase